MSPGIDQKSCSESAYISDCSPNPCSNQIASEISEVEEEEVSAERQVFEKLEEFYQDNFEADKLWESVENERVWNLAYDEKNNKILLLVAKWN